MTNTECIKAYEQLLLGNIEPDSFRINGVGDDPHERELVVYSYIRYAVSELLGWTPKEVIEHMTPDIAKKLYFDVFFRREYIPSCDWIRFDVKLDEINWRYVMSKCYPEIVQFDFFTEAVNEYRRVVDAKQRKNRGGTHRGTRFCKTMYDNSSQHRAEIAAAFLSVFIDEFAMDKIEHTEYGLAHDLYKLFADNAKIVALFKKAQLYDIFKNRYTYMFELLSSHITYLGIPDDTFWRNVYSLDLYKKQIYQRQAKIKSAEKKRSEIN